MSEGIIVAIIGAGAVIIGALITGIFGLKKSKKDKNCNTSNNIKLSQKSKNDANQNQVGAINIFDSGEKNDGRK